MRKALIRLADEKPIDICPRHLPQGGSFIAPVHLSGVEEAQFIREALEVGMSAVHPGADVATAVVRHT